MPLTSNISRGSVAKRVIVSFSVEAIFVRYAKAIFAF